MDDGDDDQAAPPEPAAPPQATAADAPAPDPAPATDAVPEPNQSMADAPAPADVSAPVPDPIPADDAPSEPNQSVADTPAPTEPNVCVEPSGSDPSTTSPEDAGSGSSASPPPEAGTDAPTTNSEDAAADGSAQPSLTDEHYDWIHQMCGKNARGDNEAADGGSAPADASVSGEMTGAEPSGAGYSAPGAVPNTSDMPQVTEQEDSKLEDNSVARNDEEAFTLQSAEKLVLAAAGGFGTHVMAGLVPGGAIGMAVGDAVVTTKMTPGQKVMYGLGSLAGAVVDTGAAAAEITIGVAGAAPTLGGSLAISAEGVNEGAAAIEAAYAGVASIAQGVMSLSTGGGGASSSSNPSEPPFGPAPDKAKAMSEHALDPRNGGNAKPGFKGGDPFTNDPTRGQELPRTDASGRPIQYKEWDVNPLKPGVNRGKERIVTGDGKAYYTNDHYKTFTRVK